MRTGRVAAMERGSRRICASGDGWSRRSTVSRVGAGLKAPAGVSPNRRRRLPLAALGNRAAGRAA